MGRDMAQIIPQNIDFKQYLKETDAQHKVHKASSYVENLKARLRTKAKLKLTFLPWYDTRESFEFRKGEVTLWCGQNGHGKSAMTSQVALSVLGQGERVCIASFEMKPEVTLQRMSRMWVGINPYTPEFQSDASLKALDDLYEQFGEWTDSGLWMYDQTGTAESDQVLGMIKYCAKELKVTHVFVDNLAKCIKNEDDYNGQKQFIDEITAIARDYGIHIHVVHHLKKPENEYKMPDKHDTKGSGAITDLVDNVFLVFRNKMKEEDRKVNSDFAKSKGDPDQFLLCRKQRNFEGNGEGEPTIKLWFHKDSQQYIANPGDRPQAFYNPWPHVAS
jgi:twinkle protein